MGIGVRRSCGRASVRRVPPVDFLQLLHVRFVCRSSDLSVRLPRARRRQPGRNHSWCAANALRCRAFSHKAINGRGAQRSRALARRSMSWTRTLSLVDHQVFVERCWRYRTAGSGRRSADDALLGCRLRRSQNVTAAPWAEIDDTVAIGGFNVFSSRPAVGLSHTYFEDTPMLDCAACVLWSPWNSSEIALGNLPFLRTHASIPIITFSGRSLLLKRKPTATPSTAIGTQSAVTVAQWM